ILTNLANVLANIKSGNYAQADNAAVTAYLDNFEYLEPSIDKYDHNLKINIELAMREHLREMISKKAPLGEISAYVNTILQNLGKAENLLKNKSQIYQGMPGGRSSSASGPNLRNLADIQALSKGFGVYTGDRRSIGQTDESSKGIVRNDVDQIESKLDNMLS